MSIKIKGSDNVLAIRWIPKYTTVERFLHWAHTAAFIPLALTGFVLFAPWLQPISQGEAGLHVRLLHRIFAAIFISVPLVYAVFQPRRVMMHFREFTSFNRYDLLWLKGAFPYYVFGRHGDMPPQPRFNTGERMNAVVTTLGAIVFVVTGIPMWFMKGAIPPTVFQGLLIIHDLAFIIATVMFMVHFYLAVVHPLMWQGLVSMRYGVVSESYARHHHAIWFFGEKRAKKMWEAHQKKPDSEEK